MTSAPNADANSARALADRTVYLIGNAHIDQVWLWRWPEGMSEARATLRSALDLLDEYPEYVFCFSGVSMLEFVERAEPELFARASMAIRSRRLVILGGWWVEPDCQLAVGESYVRQGLYGQLFLREKFGIQARTGFNPDSFGHNAMLPQILAGHGLDSYCFMRPASEQLDLPANPFRWRSADGSSVIGYRIPYQYCTGPGDLTRAIALATAPALPDAESFMVFFGIGNHGGGPTRENLESIRSLAESGHLGRLIVTDPSAFWPEATREALPEFSGELARVSRGCYSIHAGIKLWIQRAELDLLAAERLSSLIAWRGGPAYPLPELTSAWKSLLLNEFHDVLSGTAIPTAYEDAHDQLGGVRATAALVTEVAIQYLASRIDIPLDETTVPLVVVNPHPWPVRAPVEVELRSAELPRAAGPYRIVDADNNPVVSQAIATESAVANLGTSRHVFIAELPALGYRVYRIARAKELTPPTPPAGGSVIDNGLVRLEVDANGSISVTGDGAPVITDRFAEVIADRLDSWGGDQFSLTGRPERFIATSISHAEDGPIRQALVVRSSFGRSLLQERYTIYDGQPWVDVEVRLHWAEPYARFKLRYATSPTTDARFDIPYGWVPRPPGPEEVPALTWACRGESGGRGLAVIAQGKHGFDTSGSTIGVTCLRSVIHAWNGDPVDDDAELIDLKDHRFRLRLSAPLPPSALTRLARQLLTGPLLVRESFHPGSEPSCGSLLRITPDSVMIEVVKGAEDGSGDLIVRLVECDGTDTEYDLTIASAERHATIGAFQIHTLRVRTDGTTCQVTLLEDPEDA